MHGRALLPNGEPAVGVLIKITTPSAGSNLGPLADILWSSMVKQSIKRKFPQFNESFYGFNSFSKLLEAAESHGLLKLKRDQRSGTYIIEKEGL